MVLNELQQKAYDIIKSGQNLFLSGQAGCGKSFVINTFIAEYAGIKNIQVCAMTGAAAALIDGQTLHSWGGLGLMEEDLNIIIEKIRKNKMARERWSSVDTLIVDEISMMSGHMLTGLDTIAKTIRHSDRPFGGIQIVFTGDFGQLCTINLNTEGFAFESPAWAEIIGQNSIELIEIIRQKDQDFINILTSLRIGRPLDAAQIQILENCKIPRPPPIEGLKPTIVDPYRKNVDKINMDSFKELLTNTKEKPYLFVAVHTIRGGSQVNMEFIYNKLPLQQNLYIAVGAQVMLIKNLSPENGLVNGSRGIVRQMIEKDGIVYGAMVEFMSGIIAVTVASWDIKMGSSVVKIKQLPLVLATASTVHKVQGATLDYMQTNAANCFDYGMVYTLLSRVKNLDCLILDDFDLTKAIVHPAVKKFYNW